MTMPRIPGIGWVALLVVVLVAGGLWGAFGAGRRSGKIAAHKVALVDSAHVAHAKVAAATKTSDSIGTMATQWRARSAGSSARFATQRAAAATAQDTVTVLDSASAMIKDLETTVQVQATETTALRAERLVRIEADTVEAHQIALGAPDTGVSVGDVAKVTLVVVGVVAVVHTILGLLHR